MCVCVCVCGWYCRYIEIFCGRVIVHFLVFHYDCNKFEPQFLILVASCSYMLSIDR